METNEIIGCAARRATLDRYALPTATIWPRDQTGAPYRGPEVRNRQLSNVEPLRGAGQLAREAKIPWTNTKVVIFAVR